MVSDVDHAVWSFNSIKRQESRPFI